VAIKVNTVKVAITCPWGLPSSELREMFKKLTPKHDGVWENLVIVEDIYDADWIIASEQVDPSISLDDIDQNKVILFEREPPWIRTPNWDRYTTPYKFRYSNGDFYRVCEWSSKHTYSEMLNFKREKRTKKLCTIVSNKRMCMGHLKRLQFIKRFCNRYPGVMDVYGIGMDQEGLGDDFKEFSTFGDNEKFDWAKQYDYCLTLENDSGLGCASEKLSDVFMAYTVPIYWGSTNVDTYFSPKSFYKLDITQENAEQELLDIISKPVESDLIDEISKSREKIMNVYSWLPTAKRIIEGEYDDLVGLKN
tara:strand:- start:563 stop:1480 length:918 start_codon:yes stop_codon:yes gene_type:complete